MKTNPKSLAYYDTARGLVKCKVLATNCRHMTIEITANNHPVYKRGEIVETIGTYVIPRPCVYIRCGQYRINSFYTWYPNENGEIVHNI